MQYSIYMMNDSIALGHFICVGPRPFPRMRKNLKRGGGKGSGSLARQMECERGRISRDNETTSDR